MTKLERHEELLKDVEEAERKARQLCADGCAMRTIVAALQEAGLHMKDRIAEIKSCER